jgi:predicted phage terminase large subunit-like protein
MSIGWMTLLWKRNRATFVLRVRQAARAQHDADLWGVDPEGKPYLLDLWRKQAAADEWVEAFCDLVIEHKPMEWAEETGQIKAGVGPFLTRRQRERRAYVVRTAFPTRGDKSVRAQSFRGYIPQHGLYCPFNAPWFPAFRAELMSFPAGRNDDQVDMLGLLGQLLDKIMSGKNPVTKDKPKRDRWDRAFDRKFAEDDGWSDAVSWKVA